MACSKLGCTDEQVKRTIFCHFKCFLPHEEIERFVDPVYWLKYFPGKADSDLDLFGVAVDKRRGFITTDLNPYYNSFIEWQFTKLKELNAIKFGKRPSIYSEKDQ